MTGVRVSMDRIKAAVAAEFDIPLRDLLSQSQRRVCARPRQVAMTLAWDLTPHSNATIGRLLGRRDHTTVIHGRQRVSVLRAADRDFDDRVHRLRAALLEPAVTPPEPVQLAFLDGPLFDAPLARHAANDARLIAPAHCGECSLPAEHPIANACTRTDCPLGHHRRRSDNGAAADNHQGRSYP